MKATRLLLCFALTINTQAWAATQPPAGESGEQSAPAHENLGTQPTEKPAAAASTATDGQANRPANPPVPPSTNAPRGLPQHQPVTAPPAVPTAAPETPSTPSLPPGTPVHQPSTPEGVSSVRPESKEAVPNVNPRLALTLAGGGARALAQIGVIKVLEAAGIHPQYVSGASAGALIGALYSAGIPISTIEQLALNEQIKKAYLPVAPTLQAMQWVPLYGLKRLLFMKPPIGLYSGKSIDKWVTKTLPANRQYIQQFPIRYSAIAINLVDSNPVWISQGRAGEAVRASSTAPFIYTPVHVNDKALIDGGVRSNLPTGPAVAVGAPVVVAVRCFADLKSAPDKDFRKIRTYSDRILGLMLAEIEAKATANADIVIEPELGNMHIYDFDRLSAMRAIVAGEQAALKVLPEIRQKLKTVPSTAATSRPATPPPRLY